MQCPTEAESSGASLRDLVEATRLSLGADRVLITEVTSDRQYILLGVGIPLPPDFARSMPLSHSICQHVIGMRFPLSIDDALTHPLLHGSPAVRDLAIGSYLGFPFGSDFPATAMCALCIAPRPWASADRYAMNGAIGEIRRSQAARLRELSDLSRR